MISQTMPAVIWEEGEVRVAIEERLYQEVDRRGLVHYSFPLPPPHPRFPYGKASKKKKDYLVTLIKRVGGYLAEITTSWSLRNSIADISLRKPIFPTICQYFSSVGGW